MRRAATMNVGAGQYMSRSVAITMLPIIPPNRAATMDIATPVALEKMSQSNKNRVILAIYTKMVQVSDKLMISPCFLLVNVK